MDMENSLSSILEFFTEVGKLKQLLRTGWVRKGVSHPESVAGHSFRLAIMALFLAPHLKLDANRCVQLALIHDLAESQVGDLTPHDPISPQEKIRLETKAMEKLSKLLPSTIIPSSNSTAKTYESTYLIQLWQEYLSQQSQESQLVAQLDKLEMVLQASEYETAESFLDLEEFWQCTQDIWTFPELKNLYQQLVQQRTIQQKKIYNHLI